MGKRQGEGKELGATHRALPFALLRTREMLMERFRPMLKAHGVSEQQWRVLRVLEETPGIDMGALSKAANILAPSLSRMVPMLEKRGLVNVRRDPGDGRRARLSLTEEGAGLIAVVAPESAAIYAEIEARVGADRIEALLDMLDEVQASLGEEVTEE